MKTLNNKLFGNVAPVSIETDMHSNVANMPRFLMPSISFNDAAISETLMSPDEYEGKLVSGGFLLEEDIFGVYQYQYALRNRAGNTHYGRHFTEDDGAVTVFASGWSSRASVVAGKFGIPLVECYGSGFTGLALEYDTFLKYIAEGYQGLVYLGVELDDEGELSIDIAPYDVDNMYKFDDERTHAQHSIVLDTRHSSIFLDLAMSFFQKHTDAYIMLESYSHCDVHGYAYIAHDSGTSESRIELSSVKDDDVSIAYFDDSNGTFPF